MMLLVFFVNPYSEFSIIFLVFFLYVVGTEKSVSSCACVHLKDFLFRKSYPDIVI